MSRNTLYHREGEFVNVMKTHWLFFMLLICVYHFADHFHKFGPPSCEIYIYILCPKKFISPDTTWRQITMQDMDARHGM